MCVGLPARIVGIDQDGTALVDASGAKRRISAQLLETDEEEHETEKLMDDLMIEI